MLPKVQTCNDEPAVGRVESLGSAWKSVVKAEERDDAKRDFQIVEEQQAGTDPVPEQANDSNETGLLEIVPHQVKLQFEIAIA